MSLGRSLPRERRNPINLKFPLILLIFFCCLNTRRQIIIYDHTSNPGERKFFISNFIIYSILLFVSTYTSARDIFPVIRRRDVRANPAEAAAVFGHVTSTSSAVSEYRAVLLLRP